LRLRLFLKKEELIMVFVGKQPGKKATSNGISTFKGYVKKHPDRIALRTETFSETWGEMWERCTRLANALLNRGIQKPDMVATYMPNCYQFVEVMMAADIIGLPITYGNYRLTPEEMIYQINDCAAKVIFVTPEQHKMIFPLADRIPSLKELVLIGDEKADGVLHYEELIASGSPEDPSVEVLPEDIQLLLYTSGTTGKPKGAVRSQYGAYNSAVSTAFELGLNHNDSMFVSAPMYAAASGGYIKAALIAGGSLCIAPAFIPQDSLRLIDLFKPTWAFMVPIMYDWMLSLPPETIAQYDLSSIRLAVACGAPMHSNIFKKMVDHFPNAKCVNMLGASELSFVSIITAEEWFGMNKEGSIGKGIFDIDLQIFDQSGKEVGPGEIGVLYARGAAVFDGYWNNPEGTKEAFLDHEWATCGDVARMDADGYIYLVDRSKDMIISGGTNIYPSEVESVIMQMEGIADVGVIGVPDDKWGEQVKAIVVLKPGYSVSEEEIITYCRQHLAGFKIPKSVDYIDAIPRNAIGKMLKKDLRKPYWEGKKSFIS